MTLDDQPERDTATAAEPSQAVTPSPFQLPSYDAPQAIVWIASYPKSGNTWVRIFVHNLLNELAGKSEGPQNINRLRSSRRRSRDRHSTK